jgi:mannose-6-phosphate isomerase-like protein (cupin superfamily)
MEPAGACLAELRRGGRWAFKAARIFVSGESSMRDHAKVVSIAAVLVLVCLIDVAPAHDGKTAAALPCKAFSNQPTKPHDPTANFFAFDQLEYNYRVPGEFTYRLTGDQYGFETLSFIITETHPGGGPGLHVHDTEEAHVLLEGSAQYRIGENTLTVEAPYVAKVPAGVPHTFINVGTEPFALVAVFASKHPTTTRVGDNPLVRLWQSRNAALPCHEP